MNLPAPLRRAGLRLRQGWDAWWSGGAGGSSASIMAWDAAKGGDRLKNWWPAPTDFATILSPALLKSRARDAYRNVCWATPRRASAPRSRHLDGRHAHADAGQRRV